MNEIFLTPDVLVLIGTYSDYKSFINLLRTCKKYYYKKYLIEKVYRYIDYTNLKPIFLSIKEAKNDFIYGQKDFLKSFYKIEKSREYKNTVENIFIKKEHFYSGMNELFGQEIPEYQSQLVTDIVSLLYIYIIEPDNMVILNESIIKYNNVVFKFGTINIIYEKTNKNNTDIVIDITKITNKNNNNINPINSINSWKYLIYGSVIIIGIYATTFLVKKNKSKY